MFPSHQSDSSNASERSTKLNGKSDNCCVQKSILSGGVFHLFFSAGQVVWTWPLSRCNVDDCLYPPLPRCVVCSSKWTKLGHHFADEGYSSSKAVGVVAEFDIKGHCRERYGDTGLLRVTTETNDAIRELGYELEKLNTRIQVQEADQESAQAELGQTQERLTDLGASNVMIPHVCVKLALVVHHRQSWPEPKST